MRKPFQGVSNIVRFNWHFYVLAAAFLLLLITTAAFLGESLSQYVYVLCAVALAVILISLSVSFYIYDLSGLYSFHWLDKSRADETLNIVNINAGFDETSAILTGIFKHSHLEVLDFYDPKKHTEISLKRARKAYPPHPNTREVETTNLPLLNSSTDIVFAIFSAHEIRKNQERVIFIKELHRILRDDGELIITEHLRDLANLLAYNIGFFHFHSKRTWLSNFEAAGFMIKKEFRVTPFITTFTLIKNGSTS